MPTPTRRWLLPASIVLLAGWGEAHAQMGSMSGGGGRSLGGYGAGAIGSYYAGRGSAYAPYAGGGAGYVVRPPAPAMTPVGGPTPTAIGGASGMMARPGAMAGGVRSPRTPLPVAGGMGIGAGMGGPAMPSASGGSASVLTGPGLGWPFRMPPALPGRAAMGMGGP